jgi:transcriptional regulator with XRE-family HTH domain
MRLENQFMGNSLYDERYKLLRKKLRLMRLASEITQLELAEKLGVGQSYISKIERGENFIDVVLYTRWCDVCDVKAGETLDQIAAALTNSAPLPSRVKGNKKK